MKEHGDSKRNWRQKPQEVVGTRFPFLLCAIYSRHLASPRTHNIASSGQISIYNLGHVFGAFK